MIHRLLPLPPHFDARTVGEVWKVDYQKRAEEAKEWAADHQLAPAASDRFRLWLLLIDVQNTFCIPGYELYVGGRSGVGPVEDTRRLCEFIYRNLGRITQICPTMDTHQTAQIFHSVFWVNERGEHPQPLASISLEDVESGTWKINPEIAAALGFDNDFGQSYLRHYVGRLKQKKRYDLVIWPYHSMLGGIGHALVSAVEEAVFFHGVARRSQPNFQIKGNNPLTEHYSVFRPEVADDPNGRSIARENTKLLEQLIGCDALVIAGQAKSHCVAWTVDDLLEEIRAADPALARKIYLLEDCTSPVVIPGGPDFTEAAESAFSRFADAGMHRVRSMDPISEWPGIELKPVLGTDAG